MSLFPKDTFNYSSSVNQNLNSFIRKHSKDKQDLNLINSKNPLITNFTGFKKSGPVYSMHRYWTKQPIDIISYFIDHFCPPNGIVLDSFCGTGTTGTSALYTGRKVILSDLSPIATFIAKNYTEKTDLIQIKKALSSLTALLHPILDKYYTTKCPTCQTKSLVKDWIYSETYQCPKCESEIYFIDDFSSWNDIINKKHSKMVHCKKCNIDFNKNNLNCNEPIVLGLRYSCFICKIRKKFKKLDENDKNNLLDPILQENYSKFLNIPLPIGVSTNQAIHKNIVFVNQFFTPLTFFILYSIWHQILSFPEDIKSKFQFVFSSIIYRVTKLYRLRVQGQGGILSGTLYVPPLFQDINVWDVFIERFRKISKGWDELNKNLPNDFNQLRFISTHSATNLFLPDDSIDYVYIDPPYGGNINYSELNFLWESWFNQFTNVDQEVIINEIGQKKDLSEYEKLLSIALGEIYRVLKPNRWCSLVFNSSSTKIWSTIQNIINNSRFLMSDEITSLGSNMTTAKQTQTLKTARRYFVIHLFKNSTSIIPEQNNFVAKKSIFSQGIISYIINEIKDFILKSPEKKARYDEIYDNIISKLLLKYSFEEFDLEDILEKNFKNSENNYWSVK